MRICTLVCPDQEQIQASALKNMATRIQLFLPWPIRFLKSLPEEAAPYVRIMATGRSDYPNQINNVLCFPGIFRGALDCQATDINEEMKLAAANAIASVIHESELNEDYIVPGVFNPRLSNSWRRAVAQAAIKTASPAEPRGSKQTNRATTITELDVHA